MSEYLSVGKIILKTLLNNGYEAYFIGEAVRNSITKTPITKVDIITSAFIEKVKKLFEDCITETIDENTIRVEYKNFSFNIQTFLSPNNNEKNNLTVKHYSKNLLDDLSQRDFTINSIAMSHSGKLTDAYDGFIDIKKKKINHIGNAKYKFKKNPETMIKAFALMSELNYDLSRKTRKAINKRRKYLNNCTPEVYLEHLEKIFNGPYAKKAILMMNKTNIDMVLTELKKPIRILGSKYKKVSFEEVLLMAFVCNEQTDYRYEECIENISWFSKIYELAVANKNCDYSNMELYSNGLEVCLEANYINYLLGKCKNKEKKIKKQWKLLELKTNDDLSFGKLDLEKMIPPISYRYVDDILSLVAIKIVDGQLMNKYNDIQAEVVKILKEYGIEYDLNGYKENNYNSNYNYQNQNNSIDIDVNNYNQNENNIIIPKSSDPVDENDKIKEMIEEDDKFKEQLHKFISDYIKDEEDN